MEIEKLANLSRINLSLEEKEKIQKEFEAILAYISILKRADLGDLNKDFFETEMLNVVREDEGAHKAEEYTEELIELVSSHRPGDFFTKDGYVKVKHVFE